MILIQYIYKIKKIFLKHNEKTLIKNRKTNYLAMISKYNITKLPNKRMFEVNTDKVYLF